MLDTSNSTLAMKHAFQWIQNTKEQKKITIIHTNDLHSHLEHWPKMRRYLDQRKREADTTEETVIAVDLGDFVDRWHPLTEATDGKANVDLMNQGHYDAVTIGNNEGVGNPKEVLQHLLA